MFQQLLKLVLRCLRSGRKSQHTLFTDSAECNVLEELTFSLCPLTEQPHSECHGTSAGRKATEGWMFTQKYLSWVLKDKRGEGRRRCSEWKESGSAISSTFKESGFFWGEEIMYMCIYVYTGLSLLHSQHSLPH